MELGSTKMKEISCFGAAVYEEMKFGSSGSGCFKSKFHVGKEDRETAGGTVPYRAYGGQNRRVGANRHQLAHLVGAGVVFSVRDVWGRGGWVIMGERGVRWDGEIDGWLM